MSNIYVAWHRTHENILLFEFSEGWSWKDFYHVRQQANDMMDEANQPLVQIFDFHDCHQLPGNIFGQGRKVFQMQPHPHIEAVIIVTDSDYFLAVYRAFEKMLPQSLFNAWNISITRTMDDAMCQAQQILKHHNSV